jgi:membrane protein YqaA with SNARE-associated domain
MYWGTMIVFKLQGFWVSVLIAIIPAVVASGLAYFLGHKNFKFFGFITNKKPTVSNERPNMK